MVRRSNSYKHISGKEKGKRTANQKEREREWNGMEYCRLLSGKKGQTKGKEMGKWKKLPRGERDL